jgi:hypothetical protein
VLLAILLFSVSEPAGLTDSVAHKVGWLAGAIVLAECVGATVLTIREGTLKLLRKFRFEFSDSKIIRTREESPSIEIPLDQIESLQEYRGWLVVRGGNRRRQITIPREITGFDVLKRELVARCELNPLKVKAHPSSFLPLVLMVLAYFFLLTSHSRVLVIIAGISALALQAIGTCTLTKVWRGKAMPKLVGARLHP